MGYFDRLFKKQKPRNPEDDFTVTITDIFIRVEHPERKTEQVAWAGIELIKLINTDEGPLLPDIWLTLLGHNEGCSIPQGAKGYDEVYDIVSKYEGFSFDNVIKSMTCTDNAEFELWRKENKTTGE
jgi:hypothetical protein